jgi:hypothetical protein
MGSYELLLPRVRTLSGQLGGPDKGRVKITGLSHSAFARAAGTTTALQSQDQAQKDQQSAQNSVTKIHEIWSFRMAYRMNEMLAEMLTFGFELFIFFGCVGFAA